MSMYRVLNDLNPERKDNIKILGDGYVGEDNYFFYQSTQLRFPEIHLINPNTIQNVPTV